MSVLRFRNKTSYLSALAIFAVIVVMPSARVAGQNYLYNIAELSVGVAPAGVVTGYFNHDEVIDLAVTNASDNTVSILIGSRNGQFTSKASYSVGSTPAALVAADFKGTGKIDLAVANENGYSVSVLLGNGDGTFQPHVDYPVGYYPIGIVAGDFNNDGKIDLAVPNFYDGTVSILFGKGDGTFRSQMTVSVGSGPTSLGTGDFNGDRKTDLVASCVSSGVVTVLLNNRDGSFTRVDSASGLSNYDSSLLVVGDFNKDKKLDVVISSASRQQLFLMRGDGTGSLQSPSPLPPIPFNPAQALAAADFNHDGNLDVASITLDSAGIAVWRGYGNGSFRQPIVSPMGALTSLTIVDLNGDGRLDAAATSQITNSVCLFLGNGDGTFAYPKNSTPAQTAYGPDASVTADFDGDGNLDLAVAEVNFPNGQISVSLGTGKGTFGSSITSPLKGSAINNNGLLLTGDFNGDGKPDLLIMGDYDKAFGVLIGNGNGGFQQELDTPFNDGIYSLAVGDFNGDGKTDVVLTTGNYVNIYLSTGDGTFTSRAQYTGYYYAGVTAADVNHDGRLDLIIRSFGEPLMVMLGNGDGTFQSPVLGPSATYSSGLVVRDFNGDGNPDIAVGTYNGIAFLQGYGDGTFRNPVYSNPTIQFFGGLATGEVNGDGKPDLINLPYVMLGNGDGTFQPPLTYNAISGVYGGAVVADFNSDGIDDLGFIYQDLYSGGIGVSLYLTTPTVKLFPNRVIFGPVPVGQTSAPANIQLTNLGNAALAIANVAVTGDFIQQNNCRKGLEIGHSCTLRVSFKPTQTGKLSGFLTIKDNAVAAPQRITLQGVGQ